jgi:hypothetical protein
LTVASKQGRVISHAVALDARSAAGKLLDQLQNTEALIDLAKSRHVDVVTPAHAVLKDHLRILGDIAAVSHLSVIGEDFDSEYEADKRKARQDRADFLAVASKALDVQ